MIQTLGMLAAAAGHDLGAPTAALRSLADGNLPGFRTLEDPRTPLSAWAEGGSTFHYAGNGAGTRFSAVWAAIRILSGIISRTACRPMETADGGVSWSEARAHYLWPVLMGNWNEEMTAYRAKRLMQAWVCRDGNAFAFVDYSPVNGRVRELLPMRPDRVELRPDGRYYYDSERLGLISYSAGQVIHLRGLEFDGRMGISPLAHFRRTIGTALAQEEHQSRFYSNGARPGGVLIHPLHLEDSTKEAMARDWQAQFGGSGNAHRTAILDEGVKYEPITMSMVDAEFIATRKFSIADVARIYGVPMHMLAELDQGTKHSIEHQGLELERYSAADHIANWEAELTDMLLSREERKQVRISFDSAAIHSPDMESRMKVAQIGTQGGVVMPDEARRWFGLPAAQGGDKLYMQRQMVELGAPRQDDGRERKEQAE